MKLQKALLLSAVFGSLAGVGMQANALGTAAGTEIDNRATLTFSTGSSAGTQSVESVNGDGDAEDTTFTVDVKIDFSLARVQNVTYEVSNDGTTKTVAAFDIVNNSNAPVSFMIGKATNVTNTDPGTEITGVAGADGNLATSEASGNTDTDVNDVADFATGRTFGYTYQAWSEGGTAPTSSTTDLLTAVGSADAGLTSAIDASTSDTAEYVRVFVSTTDTGFDFSDETIIGILNQAYAYQAYNTAKTAVLTNVDLDNNDPSDGSSTQSTTNTDGVDVVFADADLNNVEEVTNAMEVLAATLVLTKTAEVTDNGITDSSVNIAVPGATVKYTLAVENTGRVAANNVVIEDNIPTNTTFVANSIVATGTGSTYTEADDTASPAVLAHVDIAVGTVAVGATATNSFQVTID